jgi:hypothetical protein
MNGVRIVASLGNTINLREMKNGQIGVIRKWGGYTTRHIGTIVQKHGLDLVMVGQGDSWSGAFDGMLTKEENDGQYMIEILTQGTTLEIL